MSIYVVDVESDGPCPGKHSMVSFGAVLVEPSLQRTFRGRTRPISDVWVPEALAISGVSRAEHQGYDEPAVVMEAFERWILETSKGRPVLFSDNLAFDWQFINYYFHQQLGRNRWNRQPRCLGSRRVCSSGRSL